MWRALTLRKQDRKKSHPYGFRGISHGFCLPLDLVKLINCFCKDNILVALEHFSFYYVGTCVGMCLIKCVQTSPLCFWRTELSVFFFYHFPLLKKIICLKLEPIYSASLVNGHSPGTVKCYEYRQATTQQKCGFWDLNSSPHICRASALPTEPPPGSEKIL